MVKLPHRRSFWHPCRQIWGREAIDLASVWHFKWVPSSKFSSFYLFIYLPPILTVYSQKGGSWGGGFRLKKGPAVPASQEWFSFPDPHPSLHGEHLLGTSTVLGIASQVPSAVIPKQALVIFHLDCGP